MLNEKITPGIFTKPKLQIFKNKSPTKLLLNKQHDTKVKIMTNTKIDSHNVGSCFTIDKIAINKHIANNIPPITNDFFLFFKDLFIVSCLFCSFSFSTQVLHKLMSYMISSSFFNN